MVSKKRFWEIITGNEPAIPDRRESITAIVKESKVEGEIRSAVESHSKDPSWLESRWIKLNDAWKKVNDSTVTKACSEGRCDRCHFDLDPTCSHDCHRVV